MYEILFLIGQNEESRLKELESEVEKIITSIGGKFSEDRWQDGRKLAYPIKHQMRGTYIARRFEMSKQDIWAKETQEKQPDPTAEATKKLNLLDSILRFTIVRAEGLEPLKAFSTRKDEEQQSHRRQAKIAPKTANRRGTPTRKPVERKVPQTVQKPETPQRTSTSEEIDEKLDEILGE